MEQTKQYKLLRDLHLQVEYRSNIVNIIEDFYVPCLKRSTLYRRAVGYFTSRGLAAAAQGLTALIESGGRMLLIASPLFDNEDLEAIQKGYVARNDVLTKALIKQLQNVSNGLEEDRLGYLAWLIADHRLDIRIAVPVDLQGNCRNGIYHEKLGLFSDGYNNIVAFTGSPNETAGGLLDNFETIDVFCSWDDPHERVGKKINNFDSMWENKTQKLEVLDFPHAAKENLLKYRPKKLPLSKTFTPQSADTNNQWRHQEEAIELFIKNERGILEMATGTGKTKTALRIAKKLIETQRIETVIISADGIDLLEQWYRQLVYLYSINGKKFSVFRHYNKYKERENFILNPIQTILLISRQFIAPALRSLTLEQGKKTILIHDEVHRLGSPANRHELNGLSELIRYRLGLSATPDREYDPEGNAFIENHVGPVVYRFGLEDAIQRGVLNSFNYYPIDWVPSNEDRQKITQVYKIAAAREADGKPMAQNEIWIDLAKVYKLSQVKIPLFKNLISKNPELLNRAIIFVASKEYGNQILDIVHQHHSDFHTYFADDESETLRRFAKGELECLITCHRLSEGIDIQTLQTVILLAADRAKLETIQRIGRCLRVNPKNKGKISNVIDFVRVHDCKEENTEITSDEERKLWLIELSNIKPMEE